MDWVTPAKRKAKKLSKGMGQKVQFLAAIAHDPELVILDEPFSGLDPVNQEEMRSLIKDLAKSGRTVLFSTHIMEHAEQICDVGILIDKGRIVRAGAIEALRGDHPSLHYSFFGHHSR